MNKTEIIIKQREKERLLEELASLEKQEASVYRSIFWTCFTMFVINPLIATAAGFYIWKQVKSAYEAATQAGAVLFTGNIENQILWTVAGFGIWFVINLLTLLYYLWKVSDLKSQIAETRRKVYRLDVELGKEYIKLQGTE